ncbi:SAM-dependent methyltransferase [Mycobacterium botniense]|uniref:S-adenosyl-L-methionine-dependent methyltransferase n=1 Tax=Mycobacterium botniense TaxID=84962 RepID=A0A7I9XYE2_9MYCO|nr:SAM-dependent methyltransferase [Mycobacterium botniense]GFG74822.1 putative S-adenosyl-L-methionine-dependent methyltransferase [Mycobacterium botniense]
MARTEDDSWDPASSVGATATMVAAARAAASRRPQPVISDPFAEPLVRAVGVDVFTRVAAGELQDASVDGGVGFPRMIDTFAARTRFFDEFFAEAARAGIRQAVIVASGLDTRAYRLSWPAGTTVYEIDQPAVIAFKTAILSQLGAQPSTGHRPIGIDLRGDWPTALRRAGFDTTQPTAWLAEGVLIGFLPPEAEVRLVDHLTALSAAGSRFGADYGSVTGQSETAQQQARAVADRWRDHGLDLDIAELTYPGEHIDVAAHLQASGWDTTKTTLDDLLAASGLPALAGPGGPPIPIAYVRATRRTP